ncbi:hypothetical protein BBK36DRAFT_1160586 [Trichoderma citrinoviride]|uniref:Uncharacterized protein n=1 Tax=Trichoderma citrinoviride TaxID=58853 RepID=A0A2T4B7T9_9HYPO|nr:hypothetical protein BBK36DRAFT_1160586 [Trichoderma citrinoviride]PTB65387.1 hypothetical protein BBK36DRAFT_1160586 [Trichoderma citrinoviride]
MSSRRTASEPSPSSLGYREMARGIPPRSLQTSGRALELELELMARCSHTPPPICQGGRRFLPQSRIGPGAQTENDSQTRIGHDDTTLAWRQRALCIHGRSSPVPGHTATCCRTRPHRARQVHAITEYGAAHAAPNPPQMRGRVDNTTTDLEMLACTKGLCLCL